MRDSTAGMELEITASAEGLFTNPTRIHFFSPKLQVGASYSKLLSSVIIDNCESVECLMSVVKIRTSVIQINILQLFTPSALSASCEFLNFSNQIWKLDEKLLEAVNTWQCFQVVSAENAADENSYCDGVFH